MNSCSDPGNYQPRESGLLDARGYVKVVVTFVPRKPLGAIEQLVCACTLQGAGVVQGWVNECLVMAEFWIRADDVDDAIARARQRLHKFADDAELLVAAGPLDGAPETVLQTPGWPTDPPDLSVLSEEGTLSVCSLEPWLV